MRAPGLPGSNPRAAMGQNRPSGGDGYGQGQFGDARMSQTAASRAPGMQRRTEKGPAPQQGGGRPVTLRVEKVSDRTLQSKFIFENL